MKVKPYIWIILGIFALLCNWLFGIAPEIYDVVYFRGIFQGIRVVYDFVFGWIPFPMVYLLFFYVVHLIYSFLKFKGFKKASGAFGKLKSIALPILNLTGAVIFLFYFLWGFNYQQKPLAQQLNLSGVKADTLELYRESLFFMDKLKELRSAISEDTFALTKANLPEGLEGEIRLSLERVFKSWDIPVAGRVRVRKLYPKGTLLRISTAGVYIPFVFEGHIDAGLHPIQYPFIMAHEMSHGYGIADEGTCNFTGFLTCMESDDLMIQYSATLSLWRYMVGNLRRSSPTKYREIMKGLDRNVRRDLIAVMDEMDKYPDIMPKVRDAVYNSYLKSHGIKGGIANYSTVVELMMRWKKSDNNVLLKKKIYDDN